MTLPAEVRAAVEARVGEVRLIATVGGGCIHPAHRIRTHSEDLFLKYGRATEPAFFEVEAMGLGELAERRSGLRVPAVRAYLDADEGRSFGWLLLEWLEPGRRSPEYSRRLGEGLARLHEPRDGSWGSEREGYIGTLPQSNLPAEDWPDFWRRRRLEPQLGRARQRGLLPGTEKEWARLLERLPEYLAVGDAEGTSLLHGDLWGGNILATATGEPAIVDPAVYRGHREVDLAMIDLFGGFDAESHAAYQAIRPLRPGYLEVRRGAYQLYYLLVHVNLFGEGYVARTTALLRSVLASL